MLNSKLEEMSPVALIQIHSGPSKLHTMLLDKNTPLSKTELGREAIARRLPVLPARLRPVLIMMDGKRTVAELSKLADALGGINAIDQLLALDLAEAASADAPPTLSPTLYPLNDEPLTEAGEAPLDLAQLRVQLANYFEAELGLYAQVLAGHIRACQKARDLRPLVAHGLEKLQDIKGLAAVKAFHNGLGKQLPRT